MNLIQYGIAFCEVCTIAGAIIVAAILILRTIDKLTGGEL